MTRLILSPLVGLMMGVAVGWAVYGTIVLAIAGGPEGTLFTPRTTAQGTTANTPQSPSSPTGEKE